MLPEELARWLRQLRLAESEVLAGSSWFKLIELLPENSSFIDSLLVGECRPIDQAIISDQFSGHVTDEDRKQSVLPMRVRRSRSEWITASPNMLGYQLITSLQQSIASLAEQADVLLVV
jgi:hypothetical protein